MEKNIGKFIVWDFLEIQKEQGYSDFQKKVSEIHSLITKEYKKYEFIKYLDKIYNLLIKIFKNKSKNKIFFRNIRFPQFIEKTKKEYPTGLIVSGKEDRLYAIKKFLPYISVSDLYSLVQNYLHDKNEKHLYKLVNIIEKRLRQAKPDYIILWNDCFPIERAIVLASKRLKILTIQIQVGTHTSRYSPDNGRVADYSLVWGEFFKKMYLKYKLKKPENIFVLGYPHRLQKIKGKKIKSKYSVVYLGQNTEDFKSDLLKIKIKTLKSLNNLCTSLGMNFIYRPHPNDKRELLKKRLPQMKFSNENETLKESFEKADILISICSTALIEAAMSSKKVCIQLQNYPLKLDNFEKLGICKSFNKIIALEKYLKLLKKTKLKIYNHKFNENYIKVSKNPSKRFLEILEDIMSKQKN